MKDASSRDTAHARLDDAKAHLKDLIGFDTVSKNSNRALIDHMAAHFEALGGEITILPDETGEKANLVARFGPADRPGVVLSGHTDVVPARPQNWRLRPSTWTNATAVSTGAAAAT